MLTDRQQKFYSEIELLLSSETEMTDKEKARLETAKEALDSGRNFRDTIHTLMVDLRYIQSAVQIRYALTQGGLSDGVQQLYDDLVKAYGNPVDEYAQKAMAIAGARFYTDDAGEQRSESIIASPFTIINFLSWILFAAILFISLFAFHWLISALGMIGTVLFYVIGLGLAFFGLAKKKKG